MPRQSRTDRLLAEQEHELEGTVARAVAEAERLGGELRLVRDLRKRLAAAMPKRTRTKRLVPANTQPATATAA